MRRLLARRDQTSFTIVPKPSARFARAWSRASSASCCAGETQGLVRTGAHCQDPKNWLLIKHRDRFAATIDITSQNRSVLSGVAVEE